MTPAALPFPPSRLAIISNIFTVGVRGWDDSDSPQIYPFIAATLDQLLSPPPWLPVAGRHLSGRLFLGSREPLVPRTARRPLRNGLEGPGGCQGRPGRRLGGRLPALHAARRPREGSWRADAVGASAGGGGGAPVAGVCVADPHRPFSTLVDVTSAPNTMLRTYSSVPNPSTLGANSTGRATVSRQDSNCRVWPTGGRRAEYQRTRANVGAGTLAAP
jgi:hypothetical protein